MPPTVNHPNVLASPTYPSMTTAPSMVFTQMVQCAPAGVTIPRTPATAVPQGATYYPTSPAGTYVFDQSSQQQGGWVPVSCGDQGRIVMAPVVAAPMNYYQLPPHSMPLQPPSPQATLMPAQPQQTSHPTLSVIAYAPAPNVAQFPSQQSPTMSVTMQPLTNSANMQIVWHSIFEQLFSSFRQVGHVWQLIPSMEAPSSPDVRTIKDSAKVRFLCQDCGNAWTSMKGRIVFWTTLDFLSGSGIVCFKLFGQQCEKCSSGKFEHSMWYPEEVGKVVQNVFNRVGEIYYGFEKVQILNERRPGKPRTQHNSKLCQACADHVCTEGRIGEMQQPLGITK